jgi:hypothetical protein
MVDTIAEARFTIVMLSRSLPLLFTTVLAALASACTGTTEPNTPTEEGTPTPTTTAENAEAGYTVALPQGSSTTPTEKSPGQYEYTTPNGSVFITVRPGDRAAFEAAKAQVTAKATSFSGHAKSTDTQLSSAWRETATGPRSSTTLLFATSKIYECNVTSPNASTLVVCQSLKAL